jgi:hypothetical protein
MGGGGEVSETTHRVRAAKDPYCRKCERRTFARCDKFRRQLRYDLACNEHIKCPACLAATEEVRP